MRIMGFDVGTKKTGVAIGQTVTKTANPIAKIYSQQRQFDWKTLDKLVQEWRPNHFIVGIPLDMAGNDMIITPVAKQFLSDLIARYPTISADAVDERLTTKAAKQTLFEQYGYSGLQSKDIDGIAACLLLEQWMQHNDNK